MQEEELRGVEDYLSASGEVEPFVWVEELRCCVFDAAVGGGDVHLCFVCLGGDGR